MEETIHQELDKPPIRKNINKNSVLIRIFISFAAFFYIANIVDWLDFIYYVKQLNFTFVFMALLSVLSCVLISAYKWYILCRINSNISFYDCFRWYYIGFFFNNFLPGSIGGDVLRIFYASKQLGSQQAVASVSVERLFAGMALIVTTVTGLLTVNLGVSFWGQIILFLTIVATLLLILFYKPIQFLFIRLLGEKIAPFYEAIDQYKGKKQVLLLLFVLSLLFQVFFVLVTTFLFLAMDISVPFMTQLGFVSIISIITMLPISMNGIGIREGSYVYLFSLVGIGEAVSMTVSLLFFVLVIIGTSVGGLFWINEKRLREQNSV